MFSLADLRPRIVNGKWVITFMSSIAGRAKLYALGRRLYPVGSICRR